MPDQLSQREIMALEKAMDRVQEEFTRTGKVDPLYLARADAWSRQGDKDVLNSTDTNGKLETELVKTKASLLGFNLVDWTDQIEKTRESINNQSVGKDVMTVKSGMWQSPMLPGRREESWQVEMQRKVTDATGKATFEANLKCDARYGSAYVGTGIPRIGMCEGTYKTATDQEAKYRSGKYFGDDKTGYFRDVFMPGDKSFYIVRAMFIKDPATGQNVAVAGYDTGPKGYLW